MRILVLIITLVAACGPKMEDKLMIAAAANMQFAMEELTSSFSEETGIACETVISSSGKLTAQILEGAPYHIFMSADMKYPEKLFNAGLTTGKPEVYAYGKLVIWSMINETIPSINLLTNQGIAHIAIANPKIAPYGVAAVEVLHHYKIYEEVEDKLVYGESLAQTNQFITTKAAEIGFTSKSVVLSDKMKGRGSWIDIDPDIHTPISQGVVILKNSKDKLESAQMFYEFLQSEKGKEILNKFGYIVNN